jgi:hypothetical protein
VVLAGEGKGSNRDGGCCEAEVASPGEEGLGACSESHCVGNRGSDVKIDCEIGELKKTN